MNDGNVLTCRALNKSYEDGKRRIDILSAIDFTLVRGETSAIVGASGSGKTTLLNLLAGLDLASSGEVSLVGNNWANLSDKQRSITRNKELGFVYQMHHLLPEFSALENVMMPLMIAGVPSSEAKFRASDLLAQVGLELRLTHRPSQLSGGERQRVAIARALVNNPACVLMDEPTGNLDEKTADEIKRVIQLLKETRNMAFLIVTHDEKMLQWVDSAYRLKLGCLTKIL